MKQKEERFKYIFSLKLAGYLMMHGQRIIRINHNLDVEEKDVYVFYDTPELCRLMTEYSRDSKEKKNGNHRQNCNSKTEWKSNILL